MSDFELVYPELKEPQIPEFMREGAPEVFFPYLEGEPKADLPKDPRPQGRRPPGNAGGVRQDDNQALTHYR